MSNVNVLLEKLNLSAKLTQEPGSIGFDLYAERTTTINPLATVKVATGVCLQIPEGFVGVIKEKSGVATSWPLMLKAGVIDPNYTGEIKVVLFNYSERTIKINAGTAIAQILFFLAPNVDITEVDQLLKTNRGPQGFGSSQASKEGGIEFI